MVHWFERGGECQLYRPVFWHRVGIPGSGQSDGFRADVEFCCVFKRPGVLPWADVTACGHVPLWSPGGAMSYRQSAGTRRNKWGKSKKQCDCPIGPRDKNGKRDMRRRSGDDKPIPLFVAQDPGYVPPVLANPGNYIETHEVIHCAVGGGAMGNVLAHQNEAPYPQSIPERFIRSWCPPGGTVLDPFMGSGTTLAVALQYGRKAIGIDIRESQVELTKRRLSGVQRSMIT